MKIRSMKILINVLTVLIVVLLALSMIPVEERIDASATYEMEPYYEVDPNEVNPDVTESEAYQIVINNEYLSTLCWNNQSFQYLIKDNILNQYYWKIINENVTVHVDATTGEITYFDTVHYNRCDVILNETIAESIALDSFSYFTNLSSIPNLVGLSRVHIPTIKDEHFDVVWQVKFVRKVNGYYSDDEYEVWIDMTGMLTHYHKKWAIHSFDIATPVIDSNTVEYNVMQLSLQNLSINGTSYLCYRIPQGQFTDYGPMFGLTEAKLCWNVPITYFNNVTNDYGVVYVSAQNGDIVGGDM